MKKRGNRYSGLSRGRIATRGVMNKTETRFADILKVRQLGGEIAQYWFEPFSLRLTENVVGSSTKPTRYTPDFMILLPDGQTQIIDVKGTGPDDSASLVRLKQAADKFSLWRFFLCKETPKHPERFKWIEY